MCNVLLLALKILWSINFHEFIKNMEKKSSKKVVFLLPLVFDFGDVVCVKDFSGFSINSVCNLNVL